MRTNTIHTSRLRRSHAARRRGLGLPELLISLAIAASLLTATGFALHGSANSYQINQEQSSLLQANRLTLNRITTMVRTTKLHQPHTAAAINSFAAGNTVTDTGLDMFDASLTPISFTYDSVNKQILATANNVSHILARGVTQFQVTLEPMRSAESIRTGGSFDLLKRATILISLQTTSTISQGSETTSSQIISLSGSVMPRRNTW